MVNRRSDTDLGNTQSAPLEIPKGVIETRLGQRPPPSRGDRVHSCLAVAAMQKLATAQTGIDADTPTADASTSTRREGKKKRLRLRLSA